MKHLMIPILRFTLHLQVNKHLKKKILIVYCKNNIFFCSFLLKNSFKIIFLIRKENKKLSEIIQEVRNRPQVEGKDILSFLIAPVQRIPRYKLLVQAVLKLLTPENNSDIIEQGNNLIVILEKVKMISLYFSNEYYSNSNYQ